MPVAHFATWIVFQSIRTSWMFTRRAGVNTSRCWEKYKTAHHPKPPAMSDIEYFYSSHSAFAYLGAAHFMKIAAAAGRVVVHKPMALTRVVEAVYPDGFGGRSPAHRAYYFGREIERWAEYRGVEFKGGIPANHGNDAGLANRVLIAADSVGHDVAALGFAMMQAHWLKHQDLADPEVLRMIMASQLLDADALLAAAASAEVNAEYKANTEEAIERSVFGSPTYIVDGDAFYGQDRLALVEYALKKPFARNWS